MNHSPLDDVSDELVYGDTIAVSAPDETTVVITLQHPAAYFLRMTPLAVLRPVHRATIETYGDNWTVPGNIATNGPYFVQGNMRGVRRVFVRNPDHNPDLEYGGNIDVINITVYEDIGTGFALYKANNMDVALVPAAELQSLVEDSSFADQLQQVPAISVFYFGYGYDKPPFDNVHVRRAFSAIVDRDAFVQEIWQGQGLPMIHFTPTGMAHAPPINEVGVGFDPEFAAAELREAGYPDCEGFPHITITAFAGSGDWVEFWTAAAGAHLGCPLDTFTIDTVDYAVLINMIAANTPTEDRPHAWVMGWFADYPDANNWVNNALSCSSFNQFLRKCTAIDDLITQAA